MKRRAGGRVLLALVAFCLALATGLTVRARHGNQRGAGAAAGVPAPQPAPVAGQYYVGGAVDRPGAYPVTDSTATLRRALSAAGAAPDAAPGAYALVVRRREGETELIKADLGPLLRDGTGDEPLWPGDQVLVTDWR